MVITTISSKNEVILVKVTLFSCTKVTEGWTHQSADTNSKDRLDLFQFHPYTSLKATLIKSQSGKWTHFTPQLSLSLTLLSSLSPWVNRYMPTIVPRLSCSFQMMSNQEAHHRGWLITSPDAYILAILFGNREIKELRDICCQAPTLERPDASFTAKVASVVYRAFQKPPECNYSGGLCPLLHTRINSNWPQCVFKCMFFCACGSGRACYWQLIPPQGLCFIMQAWRRVWAGAAST